MTTIAEYHRAVKARLLADPLIHQHYPHLPEVLHHIHEGTRNAIVPGTPITIAQVLDEISASLS